MNSKISILLVILCMGLAAGIFWFSKKNSHERLSHAPIEGSMKLTDAQKKDVPATSGNGTPVFQGKSSEQVFQVYLNQSEAPQNALLLGTLDSSSSSEVSLPAYLCTFTTPDHQQNHSLDINLNCNNEGKLESKNPVGYLSKEIRVGFRMLVRCRSAKSGLYLSLNANCESAEDRVDLLLGSIRSVARP